MTKIKSRQDFHNKRQQSWACTRCGWNMQTKFQHCPECDSTLIAYFASKAELKRWAELRLGVRGKIFDELRLQPEFPIAINGVHICVYRADFSYVDLEKKKIVVEDVKGAKDEKYHDPVFKLKRKMVEAAYGIKITLV